MKNEKWFEMGIPQVERKLKTNAASGLSRKAARSRINREAGSVFLLPKKPLRSVLKEIFFDVSLLVLLLTALISLFFEEGRVSALIVLLLALGNLGVLGYRHYRSRRELEAYASMLAPTLHVVRGGRLYCIDFRSVVVGDVILVEEGDILPCDARIVTSDGLRVRMRVDRESFVSLEKKSDGFVHPRENRATEMVNMLHAGSTVEQGSARAIVTAVGRYTYLGAMTGGIELPINEKIPETLQKLRRQCMSLNLILLLAVLPFTLISLLLNKIDGGNAWLSVSFLSAMALSATTLSPLTCLWLRFFYTHRMRDAFYAQNPTVISSVDAFDRLGSIDYVFVTDGCAMTDGVLHFHTVASAQGEVKRDGTPDATQKELLELISLYHSAATGSVTTGLSGSGEYLAGLRELLSAYHVDGGALRIRCTIDSYAPSKLSDSFEHVCFSDRGVRKIIHVSCSPRALAECGFVMIQGVKQPLTAEARTHLENMWQKYAKEYRAPMIFMIGDGTSVAAPCFVGMAVLSEGVDPRLEKNLARFEQMGCRVISFVRSDALDAPKLPKVFLAKGRVSKAEFLKNHLPLTYRFGSIRTYTDFTREDILTLLKYAQGQGKKVLLLGFTEDILPLAEQADGFVSCAPIPSQASGDWDEELKTLESSGRQYSTSCTQEVKSRAEYLIERPSRRGGGLSSLAFAMGKAKTLLGNLSAFLTYLIWAQLVRLVVIALPMLLGHTVLDARHVLFFGFGMDAFAMALFVSSPYRTRSDAIESAAWSLGAYLKRERVMLICSLAASAACLILPELLGMTGWTDPYLYPTEFSFFALILFHLVILLLTFCKTDFARWKRVWRNPWLWAEIAVSVIFLLLCSLWQGFGDSFGWEKNPLPYAVLALMPSAIFAALYFVMNRHSATSKRNGPSV